MELVRGYRSSRPCDTGCAATIGNYDGVHRGHQAVLRQLREKALALNLQATVITFEPSPQEYFHPEQPPVRLTRFREKWERLAECGVDRVVCLHFGRDLAAMSAEDFIQRVLVDGLNVRCLVVGDDFRFGHDRRGDYAMLVRAGAERGFDVEDTVTCLDGSERISSTRVRQYLMRGDLEGAARLLGRPYRLSGRVRYGERLGRRLGFPTANIALGRRAAPVSGIFAARVHGLPGGTRDAAAYVGTRPAVGGRQTLLEVFLLDHSEELYGRRLQVDLLHKLREDRHFDSLDALRVQMDQDAQAARAWLARLK